jgi:hypothetical protein
MVAALERKRQRKRGERNGLSLSCRVSHEGIRVPVEKKKKEIDDDKGIVVEGERTIA